jgi:hypothetical protein
MQEAPLHDRRRFGGDQVASGWGAGRGRAVAEVTGTVTVQDAIPSERSPVALIPVADSGGWSRLTS